MIMPATRLALPTPEPPLRSDVHLEAEGLTCALQCYFRTAHGIPGYAFDVTDQTGTYVGEATLLIAQPDHRIEDLGHVGVKIVPEQRGRGYMERLVRASLPVFKQHGLQHVRIVTEPDNVAVLQMLHGLHAVPDTASGHQTSLGFTLALV